MIRIRNITIILLLFILFEGFYLLPVQFVVISPGRFRLIDTIFLILPVFFLCSMQSVLRSFQRFGEESWLVLTACALVFLSPLMALVVFGQPYQTGLLLVRHNLSYLTFFIFVWLLRDLDGVDRLLRLLTVLFALYIVLLFATQYFPGLGLIHFQEGYGESAGKMRFGESRLFFPYAGIPILLYCIILAKLLYAREGESLLSQAAKLGFILLVAYAILSTYTRVLVFSLTLTTLFALITSKRSMLRNLGLVFTAIYLCVGMLSVGITGRAASFGETNKLGKIFLEENTLSPETGRMFQLRMYEKNFWKSPLTGVGNIASGKLDYEADNYGRTYRKYGLFDTSDLGYPKIVAENGLVGLAWVVWFYFYLYRRSRETLAEALIRGDAPRAETIARGLRYMLIFLVISGFTLPHSVSGSIIPVLVLTMALMAVTRESMQPRTAATLTD